MRWAVDPDLSIHKIKTGEVYTVDELLHMCMLESAADACMAVAFDIAGSESEMAKLIDNKAQEMCMSNTSFVNITGLDAEGHYSTAEDILIFLKQALKNDKFREIFTNKKYDLRNGTSVYPTINWIAQSLNLDVSKVLGDKTGFTDDAGLCLASLIRIEDHELIMITLGAPPVIKEGYHIKDADTLIRFLEDNYNYEVLYSKDNIIKTLDIELSKQEKFDIKIKEDVKKFLPSDYDTSLVSYKYEGKETLSYLDKVGNKIGKVSYYYNDELLYEQDVVVDMVIEYSIPKLLNKYKLYIIGMVILLVILIILITILRRKKSC
jgi:D-alanyl-D-alanine carboxypeptidase (penicillin-binding protein 5/6)